MTPARRRLHAAAQRLDDALQEYAAALDDAVDESFPPMPLWLTTAQAGRRLGVAPETVARWCQSGRLRARRQGPRWMVCRESVRAEGRGR